MRKLFLGIILGSLFFVYGEKTDINLGDRIGDKINFVGAKGENIVYGLVNGLLNIISE
jgi:hypothetical protein